MSQLTVELTVPNGRKWQQPTGLFINNEFVPSKSGKLIDLIDPATKSKIASVYDASPEDVNEAVRATYKALKHPSWKDITSTNRGILVARLADLIESQKEMLATIDAWDNGKPYAVALNEDLPKIIRTIRYYSGWCDKVHRQTIPTSSKKLAFILRQSIGVVAQIIPWNYPLSMAA